MPVPVLVALAVTGSSYVLSGLALTVRGRARLAGASLMVSGTAVLGAVVVDEAGRPVGTRMLMAVALHAGVLAATTYPTLGPPRRIDLVAVAVVGGAPVLVLATAPLWWSEPPTWTVVQTSLTVAIVTLFLLTWWRLEHPADYDRWALTWMALSTAVPLVVGGLVAFAAASAAGATAAVLSFAPIGPALYVGVSRPEVLDVRGLVVRFAVLSTTVIAFVALFMTTQAVLEIVSGQRPPVGSLALVAALCAGGFHPLQVALRGVVDELLFGQRPDPLGAASRVTGQLGDDPAVALATIREALVLPYAGLRVQGVQVASSGVAVTHVRRLPLALGTDAVGELEVGLRPGDLGLSANDQRVLSLVTPLLAQILRTRALAADLQASREDTVAALEEERRRLRRDLHDGLGPRLSGIAFTSDAVRNTLRSDPDAAEEMLSGLRAETVAAINEVRDLVYGMRPPALDELGLVPAVRQQCAHLRTPEGRPFHVVVEAGALPPLTAAVEVAAYRIVVEALTNAARHSGGDEAAACLRVEDGSLVVEVRDHGTSEHEWSGGVGLSSMRERAAELGGVLSAAQSPAGGVVRATLPLPRAQHAPEAVG